MKSESCDLFVSLDTISGPSSYVPSESDMKNGSPDNAMPIKLNICRDSRGFRCVYFKQFTLSTDYLKVDERLCLYQYRALKK